MAALTNLRSFSAMAISDDEREFFVTLGEHIAQLRKAHGVTQAQLGDAMGVSQQTVQAYEVGRRRVPVSALPVIARLLSVSLEEVFGEATPSTPRKRGPLPKWQQQIEAVANLPKAQQRFVSQMLDTVLAQAQR